MKSLPRIGTFGESEFLVEEKHVIDFATDGMPAVLSTPNLIGLLERTARKALMPFLEADERSVGSDIELRHFAPTPLGARVVCTARVIHAEGREITFQIEARDEQEIIARGLHKRAVIQVDHFARRVQRKSVRADSPVRAPGAS
jgi:fluoroacetyl-CoA thioesterase